MNDKAPKPSWADESTPLCSKTLEVDIKEDAGRIGFEILARDLERRLRYAWRNLMVLRAVFPPFGETADDENQTLDLIEKATRL